MSDNINATASGSTSHRDKRQKMDPGPSSSQSEEKIKEINRKIIAEPVFQLLPVNEQNIDFLLFTFMRHAKEHLRGPEQIQKLVDEKEDLKESLMTSWRNKSFEEILKLDYLQRGVSSTTPPKVSDTDQKRLERMQQAVQHAWAVPYVGDYHHLLHNNIKNMKGDDPYMNICSIVQSSGTGKSRMVDEQAKLVYTIPMNIRNEDNTRVTYPPPDVLLRKFFVDAAGDANTVKGHYITFFFHLFSHATDELKRIKLSVDCPSEEQFATRWREQIRDPTIRRNFYATVTESCKGSSKSTQDAIESLNGLVEALEKRYTGDEKIRIVIYIDEAHTLNMSFSGDHRTRLDLLCSVVSEFSNLPFFCLLLSTQSLLRLLAPPAEAATSERAWEHRSNLRAPITETPFDCTPHLKIRPNTLHLGDLIEVDYLAKWGRPLWWTIVEGNQSGRGKHIVQLEELVGLARMKLIRTHDITRPLSLLTDSELTPQVAVVDVLLALDFEPSRKKIDHQADLVANHLRTAYSVPQHRQYFRSGYPSEPLLAEAAARQIHQYQSDPGHDGSDAMVKILTGAFNRNWIDLGQRGEVVMRLLLMRAYMDAAVEDHPCRHPPIFSGGCRLVTFINNLFSPDQADTILNSRPDNLQSNTTFCDAFKTSVIRFTHFVKAEDASVLNTEALFAAFARGMAFICHQTQKYVDFVIPILLKNSFKLKETAMSAIMVQVKRRARPRSGLAYAFTQEDVGLFPDSKSPRPYIVLIAELTRREGDKQGGEDEGEEPSGGDEDEEQDQGGKGEDEEHGGEDEDEVRDTKDKQKGKAKESSSPCLVYVPPQPEVMRHPCSIHPRFLATAYGCSGDLYKAVGTNHDRYEQLLASRDFLREHSRQDSASRSAVMRLKPLWKRGEDLYHWVESKKLNGC